MIRAKTAEAPKRLRKERMFGDTCSLCDEEPGTFPIDVSCQNCGELPTTHHGSCCKAKSRWVDPKLGITRCRNQKADHIDAMWKQTDTDRLNKESEDRTKQRQSDYEDRIMKIFKQKTELLVKEHQTMKDENDVLRNVIRSKCADNSELLVNSSTAGTTHDLLFDLGLKTAKDSILVITC